MTQGVGFVRARLGRYILVRTLAGIGIIFAAVAATTLLIDLVEQLRQNAGRTQITLVQAIELTALRAPSLLEQTLPFVVLVGAMLALQQMNRKSELIAIRAAGVSAWRFLAPAATAAFLIGLAATTILNPLGSAAFQRYEALRAAHASGQPVRAQDESEIWLRQGDSQSQVVVHGYNVDPATATLKNAVFYFFERREDGALAFQRRIQAAEAALNPGFWQLSTVIEAAAGQQPVAQPHLAIPTSIDRSALLNRFGSAQAQSFWRLPGVIAEAQAAGLTPTRFELRFHSLLAAPLMLAAMASLGAVFSLRLQRLGGMALWGLMGVGAGFSVFFGAQFASAFAAAEVVPPVLAAWAAPISGFFAALALLSYMEDG